jgi:hypothetical protein
MWITEDESMKPKASTRARTEASVVCGTHAADAGKAKRGRDKKIERKMAGKRIIKYGKIEVKQAGGWR